MPYYSVNEYITARGAELLPKIERTVVMEDGYAVNGALIPGGTTIMIDGASTNGVPQDAAFYFGTDEGIVYFAMDAVAAAADDAMSLQVTLNRKLVKAVADDAVVVPVHSSEVVDRERIQEHIDAAHGICRIYIPDSLINDQGDEVPFASLTIALREVIPGIIDSIVRYRLSSGETATEHQERYDRAILLLEELRGPVEDSSSAASTTRGNDKRAETFSGPETWIDGLPDPNPRFIYR